MRAERKPSNNHSNRRPTDERARHAGAALQGGELGIGQRDRTGDADPNAAIGGQTELRRRGMDRRRRALARLQFGVVENGFVRMKRRSSRGCGSRPLNSRCQDNGA